MNLRYKIRHKSWDYALNNVLNEISYKLYTEGCVKLDNKVWDKSSFIKTIIMFEIGFRKDV